MTTDLARFDLASRLRCARGVRAAAEEAPTLEVAVEGITRYLYDAFRDPATGERQLALARFYRTQAFGTLDGPQRTFANRLLAGARPAPGLRCLCLTATAGVEADWNDRRKSRGHQAIPLPDPEIIEQAPMIAQLVREFGLDPAALVRPDEALRPSLRGRTYGVFHVERAEGSPHIPAQADFVRPYGIASVVGFGGPLRDGDIFACILFARVPIDSGAADRFRALALDVKTAIYYFDDA